MQFNTSPRTDNLRQAAALLAEARRENKVIPSLPEELRPIDIEESYLIAEYLAEELQWPIRGWFCAATNVAIQELLGLSAPYYARLFEHLVFESPANLDPGLFPPMMVETEVAFWLDRSLPPRSQPYTMDEVAESVKGVAGSIEVVAGHLQDWPNQDPYSVIADNGTDGALVTGPMLREWRELDLAQVTAELRVNSEVRATGRGDNVLGNPLQAMTWMANERARRGDGLIAGHVHNTGTLTRPVPVVAGDIVIAEFSGLGTVELTIGSQSEGQAQS